LCVIVGALAAQPATWQSWRADLLGAEPVLLICKGLFNEYTNIQLGEIMSFASGWHLTGNKISKCETAEHGLPKPSLRSCLVGIGFVSAASNGGPVVVHGIPDYA